MKSFGGNILFLNRSDINTDEIIPAKHLTEIEKEALKPHLLEDLKLEGFDPAVLSDKQVIVTRANFGCGSSREHAVWALEENGIRVVIAESFARIFKQNMYNCGLLAIALPSEKIAEIFERFSSAKARLAIDLEAQKGEISTGGESVSFEFAVSDFDLSVVRAGGWVDYADANF